MDCDTLSGRIVSNFKQVELSKADYEKVTAIGQGNIRRCAHCTRILFLHVDLVSGTTRL